MKDFSFDDIESVETLFKNFSARRIRMMLSWREPREIARIALNQTFRRESEAIAALRHYFTTEGVPETPPPFCACPPASGLRWHDLPATWSYNATGQDISGTASLIRANWKLIEEVCSFRAKESAEGDANILIRNGRLDGAGGTLGIAYQPSSGDRMAACGPMCGDIIVDQDEIWTLGYLKTVLLHEQLHAIGLPHSDDERSVMYPAYMGPRGLHALDVAELLKRYPMEPVA